MVAADVEAAGSRPMITWPSVMAEAITIAPLRNQREKPPWNSSAPHRRWTRPPVQSVSTPAAGPRGSSARPRRRRGPDVARRLDIPTAPSPRDAIRRLGRACRASSRAFAARVNAVP